MKKILSLSIILELLVFAGTALAASFTIPLDVRQPHTFNPKLYTGQQLNEQECNRQLEINRIGCIRAEFCADRGTSMLELYSKKRARMFTLIKKSANGEVVFARIKLSPSQTPRQAINEFRNTEVNTKTDQDVFRGAYGRASVLAYFEMKKNALILMNRQDYLAERHARNASTATKFINRADRDTQQIIERLWYPSIREIDKRIEFIQRILFLCCRYTYAHGGWRDFENGWTQQEVMNLHSGRSSTRRAVYQDNKKLYDKSSGKTQTVVKPLESEKKIYERQISKPAGGAGVGGTTGGGAGGGGETLFGREYDQKIRPTPYSGNK